MLFGFLGHVNWQRIILAIVIGHYTAIIVVVVVIVTAIIVVEVGLFVVIIRLDILGIRR